MLEDSSNEWRIFNRPKLGVTYKLSEQESIRFKYVQSRTYSRFDQINIFKWQLWSPV